MERYVDQGDKPFRFTLRLYGEHRYITERIGLWAREVFGMDGEDKGKGHIVDYKDMFNSLGSAIVDYTSEAFSGYEER